MVLITTSILEIFCTFGNRKWDYFKFLYKLSISEIASKLSLRILIDFFHIGFFTNTLALTTCTCKYLHASLLGVLILYNLHLLL